MKAFHGKQEIKDRFVANAKWHQDMDKFVQGQGEYDAEQKGCMIACSFHSYNHELAMAMAMAMAMATSTLFSALHI